MMAYMILMVVGMFGYLCWFFGGIHEAKVDYRQEQLDMQAYEWAVRHDRLPTVTMYVDTETGEVLE